MVAPSKPLTPIPHPNYVPCAYLAKALDWLLQLRPNSPFSQFHLFCLDFGSDVLWRQAYGPEEGTAKLEAIGQRLADILRPTDLVTRTPAAFWVITPPDEVAPIFARLGAVIDGMFPDDFPAAGCTLAAYSSEQVLDETSESLLRLFENHGTSALPAELRKDWGHPPEYLAIDAILPGLSHPLLAQTQ